MEKELASRKEITSFAATVEVQHEATIFLLFMDWFEADVFWQKSFISGFQMSYETEGMEVVAQESLGEPPYFLLGGTLKLSWEKAALEFRRWKNICDEFEIEMSLEYEPVDENRKSIGEEISL